MVYYMVSVANSLFVHFEQDKQVGGFSVLLAHALRNELFIVS